MMASRLSGFRRGRFIAYYGPLMFAGATLLVGMAGIVRWFAASSIPFRFPAMTPMTVLLMNGLAIALTSELWPRRHRWIAELLYGVVIAIAGWTLIAYVVPDSEGPERWLPAWATQQDHTRFPGRPDPRTAASALILACAGWASHRHSIVWQRVRDGCLVVVGLMTWSVLLGYLGRSVALIRLPHNPATGMSLLTMISVVLLLCGDVFRRPGRGIARLLLRTDRSARLYQVVVVLTLISPVAMEVVFGRLEMLSLTAEDTTALRRFGWTLALLLLVALASALQSRLDAMQVQLHKSRAREHANRFRQAVQASPIGMVVLDRQGHIEDVNPALQQMFGYSKSALVGTLADRLLSQHEIHGQTQWRDALGGKFEALPSIVSLVARNQRGREFPVDMYTVPLPSADGQRLLLEMIDRRDVIRAEGQLRVALRAGGVALWDYDAITEEITVDSAGQVLLGADRKQFSRMAWLELIDERDRAKAEQLLDGDGTTSPPSCVLYLKTDESRMVLMTAYRDPKGGQQAVIGAIVDVTQKEMVHRLELYAKQLEERNRELGEFVWAASHDLKAPLRAIGNLTSWLIEDLKGSISEESFTDLELIAQRATRLDQLLDGLRAYARAGTVDYPTELVKIEAVVHEAFDLADPGPDFRLELKLGISTFEAARSPFALCIRNLVGNAVRHHNGPPGVVRVTSWVDGDMVQFSIEDDGEGIPEQFRSQVFRIFRRLKPRDQDEGSGVGLALVKKVVERYGGEILVKSSPLGGAQFLFNWPQTRRHPKKSA